MSLSFSDAIHNTAFLKRVVLFVSMRTMYVSAKPNTNFWFCLKSEVLFVGPMLIRSLKLYCNCGQGKDKLRWIGKGFSGICQLSQESTCKHMRTHTHTHCDEFLHLESFVSCLVWMSLLSFLSLLFSLLLFSSLSVCPPPSLSPSLSRSLSYTGARTDDRTIWWNLSLSSVRFS